MTNTAPRQVVIDTNCVLDLWVFDDPDSAGLKGMITSGQLQWVATAAMQDEWCRVLDYPLIQRARLQRGLDATTILEAIEPWVTWMPTADRCSTLCRDPDDQLFIDLALAHGALLVSKDREVLALQPALMRQGVRVLKPVQIKNLID
jgi:putative PIN family toxin of toxin-antitoxin system